MNQPEVPGYRIAGRLGAGASGTVWAATRERDGAAVAVKVVRVGGDAAEADRVAQELGVLQRVRVDGLVGFHEAMGLAGDPPSVAMVLDRVDGGSLASVLRARGHLSVGEAVTVLVPVARALAGLHGAGVIHGDVSPGNVLLERSGRPLLADLGVARLIGQEPEEVHGTDGFVAPEVTMGALPGPAADVYAVGALAWCCVTGATPGPPALRPLLAELAPGLPEPWEQAALRCLAPDPADRPSAAEVALLFFDAAPCEPLRLVVAGDETSLLTARIRAGTPPPVASEVAPRRRWCAGWTRGGRLVREGAGRWRQVPGRRQHRAPARPAMPPVMFAVLAAAGVGVAAVSTGPAVAGVLAKELPSATAQRSLSPPAMRSPDAPTGEGTRLPAAAKSDPQLDLASPRTDPRRLMQAIADRRAAAMNSGLIADLAAVDAPGSPALESDSLRLRELADGGLRYRDVVLTVRRARTIRQDSSSAIVRAAVGTSAYQVVDASGTSQRRAGTTGEELDFELVHHRGRWVVARVTAVTDGAG